ncbi:MAG: response regulator [Deltaproteobacteria bacterium]|nr:response regulator [Deltaproteobacteria bacterium]
MPETDARLLLVDDETVFRRNLARLLQSRNFTVFQAENGHDGLELLLRQPVEAVILDVKMPGMDGIETLRRIKAGYPAIEVILLTGQSSAADGVAGMKAGAFDYLSKPVEIDHLVGKLKQVHEKIGLEEAHHREAAFREKMKKRMAAAERLASLGTLSAGLAHEINNPLAIIGQSVKWIQLRLKPHAPGSLIVSRADMEKSLDNINTSVDRIRRITHQLLGSVRRQTPRMDEVDPKQLIDEAVELVKGLAGDKGVDIRKDFHGGRQRIWSDPGALRQVLTNLMINAVQASGNGGSITVSTDKWDDGVQMRIEDNGEGIPEENLERIFEPFFTTKAPGEGTGLGLFVIKTIMEKLGGSIDVHSRVGQRTVFTLRLPKIDARDREKRRRSSNPG